MRASRVSPAEQYRLIMECRRSGLSDQQWCLNNNIKPGTFYNWVKRLRQKDCPDIPAPATRNEFHSAPQEIVKIELGKPEVSQMFVPDPNTFSNTMELAVGNIRLRIPNGTDPVLLAQTLKAMTEYAC